jgi:hypothetical protein
MADPSGKRSRAICGPDPRDLGTVGHSGEEAGIRAGRLIAALVLLALVLPAGADGETVGIQVQDEPEFAAAVSALRHSGGTIRLRRHVYRGELVVTTSSDHPLRIEGEAGVRVEGLLLDHAKHVSIGHLTVAPVTQDAWLRIDRSRHIELHDILVTAAHTRLRATVQIPDSSHITIRRSEFRHCGDRSPLFSNCLHLQGRARHITVVDSWFHDCRGCDFVHGRFGFDLRLQRNRFERALPCRMSGDRCRHQDLVSLWSGRRLLVEGNTFGVYRYGAAQLYLLGAVDHVSIVNNLFRGTDPRVPGYRARVAIIIGSRGQRRVPRRVRVVNNTILTGARRIDGYAGSIRMSGVYRTYLRRKRPLLANNVIGLLEDPHHVCSVARAAVANVVLRGVACRGSNRVGRAHLDRRGRPTAASTILINRASKRNAPRTDLLGRRREPRPDIGAFEYRVRR